MTRLRAVVVLASATFLFLTLTTLAFADSHIRMVRLSQVDGTVRIDRNTGNGFEKAIPNMPITQGVRLQTGSNSRAEIEMEDGNTIRIASETTISFPELVLRDSGMRASTAQLTLGTAYFNVKHKKKDDLRVAFANESFSIEHEVRFRVSVDLAKAKIAVFKGELNVPTPTQTATLKKEDTLTLDLVDDKQVAMAKGIDTLPLDNWDAERSAFQNEYSGSVYAKTPYGTSADLAYYGTYNYIPGFGVFWQPFGAPIGWSPYMNGAWVWDASIGYSWVSTDPWGWLPYHYGSWNYVNGYGWGWSPSGPRVWQPIPRIVHQPSGFQVPVAPAVARNTAARPTVIVNMPRTSTMGRPAAAFNGNVPTGTGRTAAMGSSTTGRGASSMGGAAGSYHAPSAAGSVSHSGSSFGGGGMSGGGGAAHASSGGGGGGGHSPNPR